MSQVEWNIGATPKPQVSPQPVVAEPKKKRAKVKVVLINLRRDPKWDKWDADSKLVVLSKAGLKRANS